MQPTALLETALAVVRSGISIIPVATDKNPRFDLLPPKDQHSSTWKPYRERLPTQTEVEYWHQHGAQFAMVCGALGDLIAIDFDDATFYDRFMQIADVGGCVIQRSGGRGYHLLFRTKLHVKPEGLAYVPADNAAKRSVVIETRGVGNVIGMAPSLHHSGRYYEVISGDLGTIPYVDDTTIQTLLATARAMTEVEVPVFQPSPRVQRPYLNGDASVIDTFNQRYSIRDELEAAGYVPRTARGYIRPGGSNPTIEVYDDSNTAYHFNTNDPLFGATDPFKVWMYARGYHDFTSAVREAASLMDMKPTPKPSMTPPINATVQHSHVRDVFHPILTSAPMTDLGNAECLEALHGDQLRYCRDGRGWLTWSGHHWKQDRDVEAGQIYWSMMRERQQAASTIADTKRATSLFEWSKKRGENNNGIKAGLEVAKMLPRFNTSIIEYDTSPWLLGVQNGVIDLQTQTCRPGQQDDMITMQANVHYDPNATCPAWRQFLIDIFNNDQELIKYIQRVVGYCLTGSTKEQKMFLLFGGGANGKSTFISTLSYMLGDYAKEAHSPMLDAHRSGDQTNDLAMLRSVRFVTIVETESDKRLDEPRVKHLTGGDMITCRFLKREFFSYRPNFKIMMATNYLPAIRNMDVGIWRRLEAIPFTQSFEHRMDKTLDQRLLTETSGILNWALDGLRDWLAHGLGSCEAVERAKKNYRGASDVIGQFLDEKYIITDNDNDDIPAKAFYYEFEQWAKARGERAMTSTSFGRILDSKGFRSRRKIVLNSKVTVYLGLRERSTTDE
jgi:putative DNA primase/helicase